MKNSAIIIVSLIVCFGLGITAFLMRQEPGIVNLNDYPNFRIQFVDSQNGWILGPRFHQTKDGGKSWETITFSDPNDVITAKDGPASRKNFVQMVDEQFGWRRSPMDLTELQYSVNGGHSWDYSLKISGNKNGFSFYFVSKDKGFVNVDGDLSLTEDRGKTWRKIPELNGAGFDVVFFLNESSGWALNGTTAIAKTVDGGKTWQVFHDFPKKSNSLVFQTIYFVTPTDGWVAMQDTLASTTDGGETWSMQDSPFGKETGTAKKNNIVDIFFLNKEKGWVCSQEGKIALTTDGGNSWRINSILTKPPLSSIYFIDEFHGWAVGGRARPAFPIGSPSNLILETKDGGLTWSELKL